MRKLFDSRREIHQTVRAAQIQFDAAQVTVESIDSHFVVSRSTFAAQMKSFSDNPPTECVL